MPQIIVTAGARGVEEGTVTLRERINVTDFESERFVANLLERLGWAVGDATEVERGAHDSEELHSASDTPAPESPGESGPETPKPDVPELVGA